MHTSKHVLIAAILLGMVFPMFGNCAETNQTAYTWESLNIGDLKWDNDAGLWQNYGAAFLEGEKSTPVVHTSRFCASALLQAAQYDLQDDPRMEKALLAFSKLQNPATGTFLRYSEDTTVIDGNFTFFVCRLLLLMKNNYAGQLTPESNRLVDDMLIRAYTHFYKTAMAGTAYYPNAYMGDLVCAKLIQEMYPRTEADMEALEQKMMDAARYWQENNWGWGEHMSDTYGGVCLNLISQYLVCSKQTRSPVYSEYKKLLKELLAIGDMFDGGPRVPAIRSYSFSSRGSIPNYRDRIVPWNDKKIQTNHYWRESELIYAALHNAGWHNRFETRRKSMQRNVSVPCFGGITATAFQESDIRLGSLSAFPVMPTGENIKWGLAWQSFPVAFWRPEGDWGFLQWETTEDGQVKAHPSNVKTGARALTSRINPPIFGKTCSIQRGGDVLVVRIMPAIMQSWTKITDGFKLVDCNAEVAPGGFGFDQLLLKYPERTVSLCAVPSISGKLAVKEQDGNAVRWKFEYTESELKETEMIVDIWGISLNGEITGLPIIEFQNNVEIPLNPEQQKRRLTWQWPQTSWDVTIDPMAENPLQSN